MTEQQPLKALTEGSDIDFIHEEQPKCPHCGAFKQEPFSRVELDGSWCICEQGDVAAILGDDEAPEEYTVTTVMLTRDQFERLPEFDGF